ncbi:MAG: hypothetical protein HY807_11620 [Nitrospirae bacterium]|nr:hypothetical protein [Nitrospirota bacterium]
MLERLSGEQKSQVARIASMWVENAFLKRDMDKALIEESLKWLYGLIGLPKPTVYYAKSPLDCQRIASELKLQSTLEWKNLNSTAMTARRSHGRTATISISLMVCASLRYSSCVDSQDN